MTLSKSAGWDSNPRISALQAEAIAAMRPAHKIKYNVKLLKVIEQRILCSGSSAWIEHLPSKQRVAGSNPVRGILGFERSFVQIQGR